MTADELKAIAVEIWGERGWITALASALGVDRTQIWRYINGNVIPGPVQAAVRCWIGVYRETGKRPA